MNRTLLGVAVALIAGILGLAWLFYGGGGADESPPVLDRSPRVETAKTHDEDEAKPLHADDGEGTPARAAVQTEQERSARAQKLLDGATWVDVEVVLPRGTPADEKIELFAVVFAPERFADDERLATALDVHKALQAQGMLDLRTIDQVSDDPRGEELVCEAVGGNRFRAPFPKGSKQGLLRLAGRYAYLAELATVELSTSTIRLEPLLGAWLTARLRLPADLPSDIDAAQLSPFVIRIDGARATNWDDYDAHSLELADGLEFGFGGLRPGFTYSLEGSSAQFTAFRERKIEPRAGEHIERELSLRVGALIAGRVLDEKNVGLADAEVVVRGDPRRSTFSALRSIGNATTDADGRYLVRAIEPGKKVISARLDGRVSATMEDFELTDGQRVADLDFVLHLGNVLRGRVVWPDGAGAAGVEVELAEHRDKAQSRARDTRSRHKATTDDQGRFSISGLIADTARVHASIDLEKAHGARTPGPWIARVDEARVGEEIVLTLQAPIEVHGRAVNDLGAPIAAFAIFHEPVDGPPEHMDDGETFESPDGSFTVMLTAGQHMVRAVADAHGDSEAVKLVLPEELQPLTLVLPRASAIEGTVFDPAGAPVVGAVVQAMADDTMRWVGNRCADAETDERGRFRMECAIVGNLDLIATKEGFAPSSPHTVQLVPAVPVANVVLALRVGGRLEGEIYDATGAPDAGREIMITGGAQSGDFGSATSDEAGHFVAEHLAPGKMTVVATPKAGMFDEDEEAVDEAEMFSSMKMTTVEIVDGETTYVVLGAPPRAPVRLSGRVTLAGKPFNDGMVVAFAEGNALLDSMKMGRLDVEGRYTLTLDAPGDYTITVSEGFEEAASVEYQATIPEVREYVLDLEMPRGGISGRVSNRDGTPVAGVAMTIEAEGRASLFAMSMAQPVFSLADGRFEFTRLKPGTYTIRAGAKGDGFPGNRTTSTGVAVRSGLVVEADQVLTGIDFRVDEPGTIAGTVRNRDGQPVTGALVFVRDGEGRLLNPLSECTSDGLGKFTFSSAPAGMCTVSARNDGAVSAESAPVRVTAGAVSEVELKIEPGTVLVVSVEDGDGKVARANLRVIDESGREFGNMRGREAVEVLAGGFSSMEHRFGPLPSGKYRVTAVALDGTSVTKPVTLGGQPERSLRIKLRE